MSVTLSILVVLWLVAITALVVTFCSILSRKLDSLDTKIDSLQTLVKNVSVDTVWIKQKYSALQSFMQDMITEINKLTVSSESNLSLSKNMSNKITTECDTVNKSLKRIESLVSSVPAFYDETGHPVDSIVFSQGESSRKVTVVGAAEITSKDSEK